MEVFLAICMVPVIVATGEMVIFATTYSFFLLLSLLFFESEPLSLKRQTQPHAGGDYYQKYLYLN